MLVERKIRIHLEAFAETLNILVLMLVVCIYVIRPETLPLLLVAMVAEAFYLVFLPETWRCDKKLSEEYCSRADEARRRSVQKYFPNPYRDILERLSRLESKRDQIMGSLSKMQREFELHKKKEKPGKKLCDVQCDLMYLLDGFLFLAAEEAKRHGEWSSTLEKLAKSQANRSGFIFYSDRVEQPDEHATMISSVGEVYDMPLDITHSDNLTVGSDEWVRWTIQRLSGYYDIEINRSRMGSPGIIENEQDLNYQKGNEERVKYYRDLKARVQSWPRHLNRYRAGLSSIEDLFENVLVDLENHLAGKNEYQDVLNPVLVQISKTKSQIREIANEISDLSLSPDGLDLIEVIKMPWAWAASDKRKQKLLFSLILGATVIMMFGFGAHRLDDLRSSYGFKGKITDWKGWEMGALFWNLAFATWFYTTFKIPSRAWLVKVIPLLVILGIGTLTLVDWYTLVVAPNSQAHLLSVLGIGLIFLTVDFLLMKYHDDSEEKNTYFESLIIADLPVTGALSVLFFFLLFHLGSGGEADNHLNEQQEIFFSGAISFQLIASNVTFALLQGKMLQRSE